MTTDNTCERCGGPLQHEKWNSTTDIFACDNYQCVRFRTPIVTKPVKERKEPEPKIPEWLGGPYGTERTKFSARLQRLQHVLHTENKETEVP